MNKKGRFGCCFVVLFLVGFFYFLTWVGDRAYPKYYLVVETDYFHSSNKKGICKYVDKARDKGYKIKKIKQDGAYLVGHKMCKFCFTPEEQNSYNEKVFNHRMKIQKMNESLSDEEDEDEDIDYDDEYEDYPDPDATERYDNRLP